MGAVDTAGSSSASLSVYGPTHRHCSRRTSRDASPQASIRVVVTVVVVVPDAGTIFLGLGFSHSQLFYSVIFTIGYVQYHKPEKEIHQATSTRICRAQIQDLSVADLEAISDLHCTVNRCQLKLPSR